MEQAALILLGPSRVCVQMVTLAHCVPPTSTSVPRHRVRMVRRVMTLLTDTTVDVLRAIPARCASLIVTSAPLLLASTMPCASTATTTLAVCALPTLLVLNAVLMSTSAMGHRVRMAAFARICLGLSRVPVCQGFLGRCVRWMWTSVHRHPVDMVPVSMR